MSSIEVKYKVASPEKALQNAVRLLDGFMSYQRHHELRRTRNWLITIKVKVGHTAACKKKKKGERDLESITNAPLEAEYYGSGLLRDT